MTTRRRARSRARASPPRSRRARDSLGRVAALPRPRVFTNGVFDILHRGHVTYLDRARSLGASLIVGVNTDASVRRLGKGTTGRSTRSTIALAVLAALEAVNLVVAFDEDTPLDADVGAVIRTSSSRAATIRPRRRSARRK